MIRLLAWRDNTCDPKKCTVKRLERDDIIRCVRRPEDIPKRSIVLDPTAETALSPADRPAAAVSVLDCSWEFLDPAIVSGWPRRRALPFLVAVNPGHFGRPFQLNSAEALAAACVILGEQAQAELVLSKFRWGIRFLEVNAAPLAEYAAAKDSAEVIAIQECYL